LELTIVVTMLSLLATMVARAQRPFSEMILELQDRSKTISELHLAVDYLARDFGGAAQVERQSETALLVRRETAVGRKFGLLAKEADRGIQYSYKDGTLTRVDLHTGTAFVVATGLTGFDVGRLRNQEIHIKIADGIDPERHEVTLVWRQR
jgi:hypothetical protein